jgi:hydroxymethylpyrimidine kinase/phosphomethylpyrimidine kinase
MKRILAIAGSDSGGGAGIQADLKTITLLGGYGMGVLTALTAQNTVSVTAVHDVPLDFIEAQIDAVFTDIGVDSVKTGMLSNEEVVTLVASKIAYYKPPIVVVDPVMVAKSGDLLLTGEARKIMARSLLPLATLVTPNLLEASTFVGWQVENREAMRKAAEEIHRLGPQYVLLKGGHLQEEAVDLLFDGEKFREFRSIRVETKNVHGTGCTYGSAIATYLAQGFTMVEAVTAAKHFITVAIRHGLPLGQGHGPTNPYAAARQEWRD